MKNVIIIIALSALTAFAAVKFLVPSPTAASIQTETAYDRVMRTNTLRCGYIVFPPEFIKDANTGTFSGIAHDIVEGMAKRLGLNVEWREEVNFSTMNAGLEAGRYDTLCFSLYRWVPSARAVDYTVPLFCTPTNVYVRQEDDRFDNDISRLNDPEVSLGAIDGESANNIAAEDFPRMKVASLPQITDFGTLFAGLASKKYDTVFANSLVASEYIKNNPGKVKSITPDKPIRAYCHSLALAKGEQKLTTTLNVALEEMLNFGTVDKILKKYEPAADTFYRVNTPWHKE